jgi:hypothetical protein
MAGVIGELLDKLQASAAAATNYSRTRQRKQATASYGTRTTIITAMPTVEVISGQVLAHGASPSLPAVVSSPLTGEILTATRK